MIADRTASGNRIRAYGHQEVTVSFSRYEKSGRICLILTAVEDLVEAGPVAECTVELPDVELGENEVAIKTWYENISFLEWLMDEGIVSAPLRYVQFAGVYLPVCNLLIQDDSVV